MHVFNPMKLDFCEGVVVTWRETSAATTTTATEAANQQQRQQ